MPPKKTANVEATAQDGGVTTTPLAFNGKVPTENDMKFFAVVLSKLNTKIDANWDEVAAALSLKDAKCAKERFRQIKLKFGWLDHDNGISAPLVTPGSGGRKKLPTAAPGGATDSPTKAPKRKTPAKKRSAADADGSAAPNGGAEEFNNDAEDEAPPPKKAKTPRKRAPKKAAVLAAVAAPAPEERNAEMEDGGPVIKAELDELDDDAQYSVPLVGGVPVEGEV